MNVVLLTGRLTRNPEVRYTSETQMAIANFSIAVKRHGKKDETDFPRCKAFGKTAEAMEKYCRKGSMIGIEGRIQTGTYEKDGKTVYFTEVIADKVEFINTGEKDQQEQKQDGYMAINEDVPF